MICHRARRKQLNDINQIDHIVQTKFLCEIIDEGLLGKVIYCIYNKTAKSIAKLKICKCNTS